MLTQKRALKLANKIAKKMNKEEAKKIRNFRNLILQKIKNSAKKGNYEMRIHTPEEFMVLAVTSLKSKGFEIGRETKEGKIYMVVGW